MVNWDWSQGDKPKGKSEFWGEHWNEAKEKSMLFRMIMFQLRVAIPPVGLMPVELLPIESVTDQDMFFEQGNRLVRKIKLPFFKKQPFLNRRLLRNGSFFRKVTFHIVNVKRVVLQLLFRLFYRIWRLRFLIHRQNRPDILSAGEEVLVQQRENQIEEYNLRSLQYKVYCKKIKHLKTLA